MEYRDLSQVYRNKTTFELQKLRSKKVLELNRLRYIYTYFGKRDINRLTWHITQIDAELACRAGQLDLF